MGPGSTRTLPNTENWPKTPKTNLMGIPQHEKSIPGHEKSIPEHDKSIPEQEKWLPRPAQTLPDPENQPKTKETPSSPGKEQFRDRKTRC